MGRLGLEAHPKEDSWAIPPLLRIRSLVLQASVVVRRYSSVFGMGISIFAVVESRRKAVAERPLGRTTD